MKYILMFAFGFFMRGMLDLSGFIIPKQIAQLVAIISLIGIVIGGIMMIIGMRDTQKH